MDPSRALSLAPLSEPAYRTAPHNTEAEQALLGAMLVNISAYDRVADFLRPDHFYNPAHQRIFAAVDVLRDRGHLADLATMGGYFEADEALKDLGGATYLARLAASVVTIINSADYGRVILECFLRRQLIEICTETVNDAYEQEIETAPSELIEAAETKLFTLAESSRVKRSSVHHGQAATVALERIERAMKTKGQSGVMTDFIDLDRRIGGMQPQDLVILAGRPSMGKSALAGDIAMRVVHRNPCVPVQIFSLEMSSEQWSGREMAMLTGVPTDRQRLGEIDMTEFQRLSDAQQALARLPIYIDDDAGHTIGSMRQEARRAVRKHGVGLIIVDYIQLLESDSKSREQNRTQEVSVITRGLKRLAKELNVPVLALSQLSRALEAREDKRPMLSDLRDSGSIEQDADAVLFVYRQEYYLERAEPQRKPDEKQDKFNERLANWQDAMASCRGRTQVIAAKSRHGTIGVAELIFDAKRQRFENAAHQSYEGGYE